jgi:dolichol-phosphate mannosyltransferase
MKTIVVLPTYNEAENLPSMVAELLAHDPEDLHIVVVDDNSPDGTGEAADRLAKCYPDRIHVVHREGKLGLGSAYAAGFDKALALGADYIVQMDADFSHSPLYIPQLLEGLNDHDVVIGSRYVEHGAVDERWSVWRRLLSWGGNVYARLITGLHIHDVTGGFKAFRRRVLESIDWSQIRCDGYSFQIEVNYICQRQGFRMTEVPIMFEDRVIGSSKMSGRIVMEALWRVWQMRWRY